MKVIKTVLLLISPLLVGYVAICILTGGFKYYSGHRFNGDPGIGIGPCYPLIYTEWRKHEIPLLPIAFHIIYYPVTNDLIVDQLEFIEDKGSVDHDDRLATLRKEYSSFTIDSLRLIYDDQTSVILVDTNKPIADRTYKTIEDPWGQSVAVFKDAVRKKQNFHIDVQGYATKKSGEKVPFSRTSKQTLKKVDEIWCRYEEWAGV